MKDKNHNLCGMRRTSAFGVAMLCVMAGVGTVLAEETAATQPAAKTSGAEASATQPAPAASADGKAQSVSFNELAGFKLKFKYTLSETGERIIVPGSLNPQIPGNVKDLSGKKVAVRGYLLPIEYEAGKSTRFILMKFTPECLYCSSPTVCDWVDATSKEGVAVPRTSQVPVEVVGTLEVGEKLEDGLITSVYQMKVDTVTVVKAEEMLALPVIPGGVAPSTGGHGAGHGR